MNYGVLETTVDSRRMDKILQKQEIDRIASGEVPVNLQHSGEEVMDIMQAYVDGSEMLTICNRPNIGQISNLPKDVIVETFVRKEKDGSITPIPAGDLPRTVHHICYLHSSINEMVVNLPGVGAIEQAHVWGWSPYRAAYGTMYKMCCDLMYMDDSMAAMQTYHLLRTVDMLRDYWQIDDVSLYCDRQEGVYGILASYLGEIPRVYGENLLTSVEGQILSQWPLNYDNTLSYLIPGMLKYFDYNELM